MTADRPTRRPFVTDIANNLAAELRDRGYDVHLSGILQCEVVICPIGPPLVIIPWAAGEHDERAIAPRLRLIAGGAA
ncbi:MAG: hypothetical protein H6725_12500 [Sandaracinaceae bacterium]|nr:hypothetical protein [Sandaracinaceae bacterium]